MSALLELVSGLPRDLNAVVGVVLHIGSQHSILPDLLVRRGPLPALHPQDGQALAPGTIFVAPPDHHMLFTAGQVRLSRGPRENHARPALDPLFRSAALEWRERVIGVVLTGDLDDGTAGLAAVKACGGTAVVQDPATAFEPSMPANALANVAVDHCLPLAEIAPLLARLVGREPDARPVPPAPHITREQEIFEGKQPMENLAKVGQPSSLTCPECGGGLWETEGHQAAALPLPHRARVQRAGTGECADRGGRTGALEQRARARGARDPVASLGQRGARHGRHRTGRDRAPPGRSGQGPGRSAVARRERGSEQRIILVQHRGQDDRHDPGPR
ncbi:MAG TPA: chemotaxis protein CheB [Ramlibacter sp.]|nr:chemotaxis protein CheB [Ramlibacter sp.]